MCKRPVQKLDRSGIKINNSKCECKSTVRDTVVIDDVESKQVRYLKYLGSTVELLGCSSREIWRRVAEHLACLIQYYGVAHP